MMVFITKIERVARYFMSGVAMLAALGLLACKWGWIADAPSYKSDAWYLARDNAGMIAATEYADEASCRRDEKTTLVCRSGKALTEQFLRERKVLR
jgi:hypothetical protein